MACIGSQISQFVERRSAETKLNVQQHDRRVAREIQLGLLPKTMPHLPGFEISARSLAVHEVGGDCFDFIRLPEVGADCIGVLVADASGHGLGAALLSGQTRAYLRALALTCTDVGILLDHVNRCLSQDIPSDHFVTALLMKLDPNNHSLTYSGAGHPPGYVIDGQGQTRAVLTSEGFPFGIDPETGFPTSATVWLEPGDLVFLHTDGIVEAASPGGELFGIQRALRVVQEHRRQMPGEILTSLFEAVADFSHNRCDDDLTAVIIKFKESV